MLFNLQVDLICPSHLNLKGHLYSSLSKAAVVMLFFICFNFATILVSCQAYNFILLKFTMACNKNYKNYTLEKIDIYPLKEELWISGWKPSFLAS